MYQHLNKGFIWIFSRTSTHVVILISEHPNNSYLLSARTAMWSMPVVLTETENENDSANQNYVAKMTLQKWRRNVAWRQPLYSVQILYFIWYFTSTFSIFCSHNRVFFQIKILCLICLICLICVSYLIRTKNPLALIICWFHLVDNFIKLGTLKLYISYFSKIKQISKTSYT